MDLEENKRGEKIRELEANYNMVIDAINGYGLEDEEQDMTEDQMQFMNAAKRGQQMVLPPVLPGENTIGNLPG